MICALSLRRQDETDGTPEYILRVVGKPALGRSGSGGQDEHSYPTREALLQAMAAMELPPALMAKANELMHEEAHTQRFVPVATEVQIPFDVLERCDIYLET